MFSDDDRALVQRDTALPGLGLLLDSDRFAERLGHELPERRVIGATCEYVRYKPATNCLAAYRVEMDGRAVVVHAKAYRRDDAHKLAKGMARPQATDEAGQGKILLEDWLTIVCLFPNDDAVRGLRRLGSQQTRRRLLSRAVPDRPELWDATIDPLAYKPERRFVARIGTDQGVIKLYTRSGYEQLDRAGTLHDRGATLRLPEMHGRLDRHCAIVWEWLPGRLLSEALANGEVSADAMCRVGAALAELHAIDAVRLPDDVIESQCARLVAVTDAVGILCPDQQETALHLTIEIAERLRAARFQRATVHGDFYAKQVLLDGDRVGILDLDAAGIGNPAADLGNFLAHLERDVVAGRLSRENFEGARTALLEGYRAAGGSIDDSALSLHVAAGLLRIAPHPFRKREHAWEETIAAIVRGSRWYLERSSTRAPRTASMGTRGHTNQRVAANKAFNASPLDRALELVESRAGVDRADVQRVEVGRGGWLDLTASTADGYRWFRVDDSALHELSPSMDADIPLTGSISSDTHVVSYRPGRRIVIERIDESRLVIEKGYRHGRSTSHATRHLAAWKAGTGFLIPSLLQHRTEAESLVLEHMPGIPLRGSAGGAEPHYARLGAALARFQDARVDVQLDEFGPGDELAVLDQWTARVKAACGELPAGWMDARAALNSFRSGLPRLRRGLAHRDLHDGQVLTTDRGLVLLDFDLLCRADVALDPANFITHLELRALQRGDPPERRHAISDGRTFLDNLDRSHDPGFDVRLHFYRATTLLRLALVYRLRPRWAHLSALFVQRSHGLILALGRI